MWFSRVVVDPDGERVAFVGRRVRCTGSGCTPDPSHVVLMNTDGSDRVELAAPPDFGTSWLLWSPDGERMLSGSIDGIVSVAVDGEEPPVVHEGGDLNLEWSPDELSWQPDFP